MNNISKAIEQKDVRLIQEWIDEGHDVNAHIDLTNGRTPLMVACEYLFPEAVTLLLNAGADVNIPTSSSKKITCLIVACRFKFAWGVRTLIEAGANLNARDYTKATALHYACASSDHENIVTLLEAGADATALDDNGCEPLYYLSCGDSHMSIKPLIAAGANINHTTIEPGLSSLHRAIKYSFSEEFIRALIENGADVNARTKISGMTPLHFACDVNTAWKVKLLLEAGADIDIRDNSDRGPHQFTLSPTILDLLNNFGGGHATKAAIH
jgi:ankyrin repeat protein